MRISARATAFWGIVLGVTATVHACTGCTPDRYSAVPGMAFLRPDLILLYPILAGTLERPVYSFAGYRTSTWGYSIQANLLGWIVSSIFGLFAFGMVFSMAGAIALMIGSPLIGMLIKMAWFRRVPRDASRRSATGYFLLATLLSTLTIASLPVWMEALGTTSSSWAYKTQGLKAIAILLCLFGTIALHCTLFASLKRQAVAGDVRRGFEVLSPTSTTPNAIPIAAAVEPDPQQATPVWP